MRRWWWIVVWAVMILSLTGAGLYVFRPQNGSSQANSVGGLIQMNDSANANAAAGANSVPVSGDASGGSGNGVSSPVESTLQVAAPNAQSVTPSQSVDNTTTNNGNSAADAPAVSVPGPEKFGQYESYKTEQTAYTGDIIPGNGDAAAAGKWLTVHYRGWLTSGQEFDESYGRGKPFAFQLGGHRVIAGWEQGFNGMKVGGKRRIIVPPSAGYGNTPQGSIPANSVLVFDVELLGVSDTQPSL